MSKINHIKLADRKLNSWFNPAIIYADFCSTAISESKNAGELLLFLSTCAKHDIMVTMNFALQAKQKKFEADIIINELKKQPSFLTAFNNYNWQFNNKCYIYKSNKYDMGTIILYKKKLI